MDFVNESGLAAAWIVSKINPPAFSLTALVKGTFQLRSGEVAILAEEQQSLTGDTFESNDSSKPLRYASDFAPFKPRTDALLVGTCHAPKGQPVALTKVCFRIGPLTKSLVVYGDRYWTRNGLPTHPTPFITMPLTLERAFGGAGFDQNPLGKGFAPIRLQDGTTVHPLPNIESPDHLVRSQNNITEPAGFGPFPDMWPQRKQKFGSFNKRYLKERWPWTPEDIDWGFFNTAPENQQIEGYLRGDEEFYAENLHPTIAQYRSRLPGIRVRCFLNEQVRAQQELREIPMRLDTLWVDMDSEKLVMVWRGNVEVRTQKLIEIEHFFVSTEPLAQPPATTEQCRWLLEEAMARKEEEEEELEVEDEPQEEAGESEEPEGEPQPEAVESLEVTGTGDETEAEGLEEVEAGPAKEVPLTVERVKQMIATRESFAGCDLSGLELARLDFSGLDLREAILEGAVLVHANLSQADLAGAVLSGANLREAKCIRTIFTGADMTEAWLTQADLSGADLRGADLTKARLRLAILRGVNATDSIFDKADLSDAILEEADLSAADLCDARLHRADFTRANLTDTALENAWGWHVKAPGAVLRKVRGAEALMCEADFRESIADESVWESAQLFAADFKGASLKGTEFSGAYLERAVFDAAEAKEARFNEANLRSAQMHRCNLLNASLDKANLTEAILNEANLFGANLMDTVIDRTNFTGANLRRIKRREEII